MSEELKKEKVEDQEEEKSIDAGKEIADLMEKSEDEIAGKKEEQDKKEEKVEKKAAEKEEPPALDYILQELNKMASGISKREEPEAEKREEAEKKEVKKDEEKIKESEKSLYSNTISEEEFDKLFENKDSFGGFLNKFAEQIAVKVREETRRAVLEDVQQVIYSSIPNEVRKQNAAREFWNKHPNLRPISAVVVKKANEISAQNPDWEIERVFDETGKEVNKLVEILTGRKQEDKEVKSKQNKFPGAPGSRGLESRKLTGTAGEIAELMNFNY